MKQIIVVHGYQGDPFERWQGWLRDQYANSDVQVIAPRLPNPDHPQKDEWVEQITQSITSPINQTVLVGHSLGCATILRYLENLETKGKFVGVILVAGFTSDLGWPDLTNFFNKPFNWQKIISKAQQFVAWHSDDDKYVSLHYADIFKAKLNAEVRIFPSYGHFHNQEFPELKKLIDQILCL